MANSPKLQRKARVRFSFLIGIVAMLILLGLGYLLFMQFLGRDRLWSWRVRGKFKAEEVRHWAFQVLSNSTPGDVVNDMLTNAPRYLANSDRHKPSVLCGVDCVHVIYGGGLYHWGLTVGDTNLPPEWARGKAEQWAPGIYFWNN